jgi:hypothetical protein
VADGPALLVEAWDGGGRSVVVQSSTGAVPAGSPPARLIFDQPQAERHVTIPELNLVLRIVSQETQTHADDDTGSFLVQGYETGSSDPIVETVIQTGWPAVQVGSARIQLTPTRYSLLRGVHAPGLALLLTGGLLVLLGVTMSFLWPALQVWVQLSPDRRAVSAEVRVFTHSARLDSDWELQRLAATLGEADGQTA